MMILVLDSNVLVSAIIRDSVTRRIIIASDHTFILPEATLQDIRGHRAEILAKSGLDEAAYERVIHLLLKYVTIVPTSFAKKHMDEAGSIMGHIDPGDVIFVATAIAVDGACIWSNDRHFERQGRIKVFKTKDLLEMRTTM